ncbi:MAG TPA: leucyl aminopeptidase [Ignavibacteria bacterium]|nr:leucyl aminopeptidase [Ignavibacteria bacterium]
MLEINFKAFDSEKVKYSTLSLNIIFLINDKSLKNKLNKLDKTYNIKLSKLQKENLLSEDVSEIRVAKQNGQPDEFLFHKVKLDEKFNADYFRNYCAGLISKIKNEKIKEVHVSIPKHSTFKKYFNDESYFYQTFAEGFVLGNYNFDKYLSDKKAHGKLNIIFNSDNLLLLRKALNNAKFVTEGVNFTKDLQNEPGITLTPSEFAKRISSKFRGTSVKVTVMNEREIKQRKMGGLLAVGMGSSNPPRFIVMRYNGLKGKANKSKPIAIVGKGITFDSGGISIKPSNGMGEMKADMSGAAVVVGLLLAAEKAKLPVNLIGIIASAENMPSGTSMRPGDIVITSSGKSIEVDNTDAEGRMVLADALHYASKQKPQMIIDLATLTGACVVALGELAAGMFTKDDKLKDKLYSSGLKTYDRVWQMPLWDDYNYLIKSNVADVKNIGGRWGGAITAAKFLEMFVDKNIPWVHLDIAGPAMPNDFNNYTKKYMTGFGVRLLFDFLSE